MGRGATAAHQTLNLWILVRIRAPQLEFLCVKKSGLNEGYLARSFIKERWSES